MLPFTEKSTIKDFFFEEAKMKYITAAWKFQHK